MGAPKLDTRMTYAEYLEREAVSEERHEFHRGEMFAMSGGSSAHAQLIYNAGAALKAALRDQPCKGTSSAQRVRITDDVAVYPDAMVVCPPLERPPEDPDAICNPRVVVEVLSPSTQGYDRGPKFELYTSVSSIEHIVFVAQERWRVEHYRRLEDGNWYYEVLGPGDTLALNRVGANVAIDALYEDIELFGGPADPRQVSAPT
jgi:Uma2 family endonuclease